MDSLEILLNEFYHHTTSNDRKKQIENELIEYKNHPNSWQQSLLGLQNSTNFTQNQYLWFFNASTIECTIIKRWTIIRQQDRIIIRDTLWRIYANLPEIGIPKRQRDTIAQLLALMGKRDFPNEYPNYMNNIIELLKTNCILGIVLLRITSEEVVNPRDDISFDRKKYFHSCVSSCLPEVVDVIGRILHASVCEMNQQPMNSSTSLPNDNQSSEILLELLPCVQHLISWISLELVSDCFFANIIELSKYREQYCEISIGAISILNELFYVQRSIQLPDSLLKGIKTLLQQPNLDKSNELYQDKFTELLRLYTNKYWSKLITDNEIFPTLVIALYQYTFAGYGALAFTERLEIWTPLIKGLITNDFNNGKYLDIMHTLVGGILKKMQFRFDQEQELETLDNEVLDDNMETEWQHYLTQCIETIAHIAEGCPVTVFEQVFIDWQRLFEIFVTFERQPGNLCHFIHCILRDLSTLCQTIVRLTSIIETCYENNFTEKLIQIKQYLMYLLKFLDSKQFRCFTSQNPSILNTDISELHSQVLLAIRSLLGCSTILNSDTELKELIEEVGKILLPITKQESRIVTLAAAQLLLRISTVIRPRFLLECNSILQLMQAGPNLSYLPKQVVIVIYQMIFSCLILPWSNIEQQNQDFERRNIILQNYIQCLASDFLQINDTVIVSNGMSIGNNICNDGNESKISAITTSILPILKDVIEHFIDSSSAIKQMLTNNFKCIMTKSLSVYQNYGSTSNEVAESIFDFSLSILKCLQIQLGSQFVQQMITIFLESFSKEQFNTCRLKVLEKILRMLILIVEQPGSTTMSLIPSILNLSIYHALPWLQDDKNSSNDSDAIYLLYTLFDGILQHRWQYFYKSQVLRGFSPGASDCTIQTNNEQSPHNPEQFLAILTAYGHVLVNGNDPHLNRIVLTSLQNLNDKWKLYNRDFFKNNLLQSFQYAIINSLFSAEGAIYYDLLLNCLYSMGQVNITKLHDAFISLGYKDSAIVNDVCLATDLPTFSQKVTQLIQDTRRIRLSQ